MVIDELSVYFDNPATDALGYQHVEGFLRCGRDHAELHFKEKQTVTEYAELLHKSPKTLANLFSKNSQTTPLKIIHERIGLEARRLLIYTDKPIKEIGWELAFAEDAHFSRFFKRVTGYSPTGFRREMNLTNAEAW